MRIHVLVCIIFLCSLSICPTFAQNKNFPTLNDLDKAIVEQQTYVNKREENIRINKKALHDATTEEERYRLKNLLFNEYTAYKVDSSLHYAKEKLISARKLEKQEYIDDSHINIARVLILAGMYKEAFDILDNIDQIQLVSYLKDYYYQSYNLLYESMLKHSLDSSCKEMYRQKATEYKDSILMNCNYSNPYIYADRLIIDGNYQKGLNLLLDTFEKVDPESREIAYTAYAISDFYRRQGNVEEEKKYLIVSALSDIKWGIKEYISLWRLATILYQEGDIERAYTYVSRSLDDAAFSNARLRTLEITQTLPIIQNAYLIKSHREQQRQQNALIITTILILSLVIMLFFIRIQLKRLSRTRSQLNQANQQLQKLNVELKTVNGQLLSTNNQLNEANHELSLTNESLTEANNIKETYITQFMSECSAYIDKIDTYRRQLNKLAASGKLDELYKELKSSSFIEKELESFYSTFDETFLHLFPDFVEQFNKLLRENEIIVPPKKGGLSTELRVFALLRLGITDNERIASFLRCSKATIYSYRSRVRLKSFSPDRFEEQIMHI